MSAINRPSEMIMLLESNTYWPVGTGPAWIGGDIWAKHTGAGNYLFVDGHVKAMKPTAICGPNNTDSYISNNASAVPCGSGTLSQLGIALANNS
jgi:prepilin-type processing-associated H-X9-DG protein